MNGEMPNQTYFTGEGADKNDWNSSNYENFQPQGQLKQDMQGEGFDSFSGANLETEQHINFETEQYIDSLMADALEDVAKSFRQRIEERRNRKAGEAALNTGTTPVETQPATNAAIAQEQAQVAASGGAEIKTGTDN